MGILGANDEVEHWLTCDAEAWRPLSDTEYIALIRGWSLAYPTLGSGRPRGWYGIRAIEQLTSRLPADVTVFNGVRIPVVANTGGGRGVLGYRATGLRAVKRELANRAELIVAAVNLAWCCVFTHEAGSYADEMFLER